MPYTGFFEILPLFGEDCWTKVQSGWPAVGDATATGDEPFRQPVDEALERFHARMARAAARVNPVVVIDLTPEKENEPPESGKKKKTKAETKVEEKKKLAKRAAHRIFDDDDEEEDDAAALRMLTLLYLERRPPADFKAQPRRKPSVGPTQSVADG
ncbi:uncharacterized protein LTR77_007548 [Saxophila tyrrhenica]|uniref:Uncharacterized protein n=1 Tax=Saxophila tyrrhenica TaxID=1690608 RepID=A0AAV9P2D0_9PEZI|nr:hypothetical protein LTR77_007548 [Saxophila tyrrhenica]